MLHFPEHFQSYAQTFVIYHCIFINYKINVHEIGVINGCPPYELALFEGKTGTGKYFVTETIINITRLITQQNPSDMASAPTSCAAALIGGSTHCWFCSVLTGQNFQSTPKHIETTKTNSLR